MRGPRSGEGMQLDGYESSRRGGGGGANGKSRDLEEGEMPAQGDGAAADDGEAQDDPDADAMAAMMGFGGFGTTKVRRCCSVRRTAHASADATLNLSQGMAHVDAGAADARQERKARQYMNRRGGFNRPLDKMD